MFKDFNKRLQRDIKRYVDFRLKQTEELSKGRVKVLDAAREMRVWTWTWRPDPNTVRLARGDASAHSRARSTSTSSLTACSATPCGSAEACSPRRYVDGDKHTAGDGHGETDTGVRAWGWGGETTT